MAKSSRASTKQATKRPAQRRNREKNVAEAAVEVFWKKGYPSASIQDVADQVGVLKGSLYYYIDSKEDLLDAIVTRVHERSVKIYEDVKEMDGAAVDRLWIYIERHALWYLDNPKEVTVFLREWQHLTGERLERANSWRRGYDRALRELITDVQSEDGIGPEVNIKYASLYVLAAMTAMPQWYQPDGEDPPEQIATAYANMTVGVLTGTHAHRSPLVEE